jgi:WD40 repeat protein
MVMSVAILYVSSRLTLVVGYESGHAMVVQDNPVIGWCRLYLAQPHSQPILSLGVTLDMASFITSGADGIIAKHSLSSLSPPLAQPVQPQSGPTPQKVPVKNPSLLSGMFAQSPSTPSPQPPKAPVKPEVVTKPLKVVQTMHSGQQSLRIRSDGRIFATAGWDTKVRVYSVASMKELAVLKWHKDGCFAVAFAEVINAQEDKEGADEDKLEGGKLEAESSEGGETALTAPPRRVGLAISAREKRIQQATHTHWVAAGSKDGKVSLWEIY